MKNIISLVVIIAAFILFTGCSKTPDYPVVKHIENSKAVEIDVMEEFAPKVRNTNSAFWAELYLYDGIKKAAEYTLSQGYSHFAVLNGGINNLEGFPITNYKDLKIYCFAYKYDRRFYGSSSYAKCEGISYKGGNKIHLKIIPVNESNEIFSWNAQEILALDN